MVIHLNKVVFDFSHLHEYLDIYSIEIYLFMYHGCWKWCSPWKTNWIHFWYSFEYTVWLWVVDKIQLSFFWLSMCWNAKIMESYWENDICLDRDIYIYFHVYDFFIIYHHFNSISHKINMCMLMAKNRRTWCGKKCA